MCKLQSSVTDIWAFPSSSLKLPPAGGLCILYLLTQFTHFFAEKCLKGMVHEIYENYFSEYNFICWTVVIKVKCDGPIQP
jgi:hypothetical protein